MMADKKYLLIGIVVGLLAVLALFILTAPLSRWHTIMTDARTEQMKIYEQELSTLSEEIRILYEKIYKLEGDIRNGQTQSKAD